MPADLARTFLAVPILCLLFVSLPIEAQQAAPDAPPAGDAAGQTEAPAEAEPVPLAESTLALDIATADYYELIAWTERLGLSTRGTRSELQQRLASHYGVTLPEERINQEDTRIDIESARRSDYFTIEEADERYIRLVGEVLLELTDPAEGTIHRIRADRIVFNQTENLVTASGGIEYSTERDGETETFTGESLTFAVDSWEGVFFDGVTVRERTVNGEKLQVFVTGEVFTRAAEDVVVLRRGTITTSKLEDPYYHVAASKIWILGPGEWGLRNAILSVGRIPMLYLPFFFLPGDELVFHPAFGYRIREGYFIQTTTYLLGRKDKKNRPFSFMQAESEDTRFEQELNGIWLRKTEPLDPADIASEENMKLLFDYYSRLGYFTGLEGDFPGDGSLRSWDFFMHLGFSRTLYPTSAASWSPYRERDGVLAADWNESRLFAAGVPFRYGIGSEFDLRGERFTLEGSFLLYSDPFLYEDYYPRSEDIDWSGMFGLTDPSVQLDRDIENYSWDMESTYRFDTAGLSPGLSTLSVTSLDGELRWQRRQVPSGGIDPVELAADPGREFFYPETLILPEFQMTVAGTIYSYPGPKRPAPEPTDVDERSRDLRPPWAPGSEEESAEADSRDLFKLPDLEAALPAARVRSPFTFNLSYSIYPRLVLENDFNDAPWQTAEDIDYEIRYSSLSSPNNANLVYTARWYEEFLSYRGSLAFQSRYRTHFNRSSSIEDPEWEGFLEQDRLSSSFSTTSNNTFTLAPLLGVPRLDRSTLSYTIDALLFDYRYSPETEAFESDYVRWNDGYVKTHRTNFTLALLALGELQRLSLTAQLPPLDEEFRSVLGLVTGPLFSEFTWEIRRPEDRWVQQPLLIFERLTLADDIFLSENLAYDLEGGYWNSSVTRLSLRFLDFQYVMSRRQAEEFDDGTLTWMRTGEERIRPDRFITTIDYEFESDPFWKDRIWYSMGVESRWNQGLQIVTDSMLSLAFQFTVHVEDFLDLTFSSFSQNDAPYRYIGALADDTGEPWVNPLTDLFRSVNFFNDEERFQSLFKIKRLSVRAVHHLADWDMTFEYAGSQELQTDSFGIRQYEWVPIFSIFVQWNPIPEIKSTIESDETGLTVWR